MSFGKKKLDEIIKHTGTSLSPEKLAQLNEIIKEIDELYEVLLRNQAVFGEALIKVSATDTRVISPYDPEYNQAYVDAKLIKDNK
jgi:hypothetical protein